MTTHMLQSTPARLSGIRRCFRTEPFHPVAASIQYSQRKLRPPWNAFPTRLRQRCRILVRCLEEGGNRCLHFEQFRTRAPIPPEGTGRMNSSRTEGGRANGKRTTLVSTRGVRPACDRNHPDVDSLLDRHGREHLRGSNGNGTRRETGKGSPAGRAPELRGRSEERRV